MALDIKIKNKLHKPPMVGSFTGDKPAAIASRRANHLQFEQKQIVQSEADCEEHTLPQTGSCWSSGTVCWNWDSIPGEWLTGAGISHCRNPVDLLTLLGDLPRCVSSLLININSSDAWYKCSFWEVAGAVFLEVSFYENIPEFWCHAEGFVSRATV